MTEEINSEIKKQTFCERNKCLSTSKKVIVITFLIWFAQALPKWTAAITADDELSADIMKIFIEPRSNSGPTESCNISIC